MLSKELYAKLNEQLGREYIASNIYLNMSSWCYKNRLKGSGNFLLKHAMEEYGHMQKIFNFINETGGQAIIGELEATQTEYSSVEEVFKIALENEVFVSACISGLVTYAHTNKDYPTFSFLQWFINEQVEEEALFCDVCDKIEMLGGKLKEEKLFLFDREMQRFADLHQ